MVGNFNTCVRHATGEWVHILHGDDTVRPGFYYRLHKGVLAHPEVDAALTRVMNTDENGWQTGLTWLEANAPGVLEQDFVDRLLIGQRVEFAGMVVRRSAYEELGGFRPSLRHCMDWDMWKRIALHKRIYYEPAPLACFRARAGADSGRLIRSGENVADELVSIDLTCLDLPPAQAKTIRWAARLVSGVRAARHALQFLKAGDRAAAWKQWSQAGRCSMAPAVTARLVLFLLRAFAR